MSDAVIAIEGLEVSLGGRRVLQDLTFSVPPGSMFGFVGPNGAGKTTTMRCLLGIVRPDAGRLEVLGEAPAPSTRLRVGYMPEERGLYPKMPALRQIAYFARLNGSQTPMRNARRRSAGAARAGRAAARSRGEALAGQPAAGPAGGGARARSRAS